MNSQKTFVKGKFQRTQAACHDVDRPPGFQIYNERMPLEAADGNLDAAIAVLLDGFRAYDRFPDLGKRLLDAVVTEIFLLCGHIPRLHLRGAGSLSGHASTDRLNLCLLDTLKSPPFIWPQI